VYLWSPTGGPPKLVVKLPKGRGMYAARFDDTGRRIVYVDGLGAIAVRDLPSGRDTKLTGAGEDVFDAQFSPDGNHVAATTQSGKIPIWRLDHPDKPERVIVSNAGFIYGIAYSRDGRLATANADRTIRIFDPRGGSQAVLRGHTDEVNTVQFTYDGAHVISASADGTLRLWDAAGGDALDVLQSGGIFDVAVSRDGRIASAAEDGAVTVFRCTICGGLDQVLAAARSRAPRPLTPAERQRFLAASR
jgi:WD40 repeat protein